MRAGKLNKRCTIERPTEGRDSSGGEVKTWHTILTNVAVAYVPLNGREYYAAQQLQSEVTARFEMRFHNLIDERCRVKFEGTYYEIIAVIDIDGNHQEHHLMCRTMIDA